jgi:chemotaxis protein methyltransferase CheR
MGAAQAWHALGRVSQGPPPGVNRARRRARELGLSDLTAYRAYLETHPEEWAVLDQLTPITISRFHRDRGVFEHLAREVLPTLAARAINRGSDSLEIWSAGCAFGEEPYTLAILWEAELTHRFPSLPIRILSTDTDPCDARPRPPGPLPREQPQRAARALAHGGLRTA